MYKNKFSISLLLTFSFGYCLSQPTGAFQSDPKGIQFEKNGLTWEEVLAKAKGENKLVFVDLYATWCAPCKLMDKEIYTLQNVGDYINKTFISVKVQMDTSRFDGEGTKKWYNRAHTFAVEYSISGYPSYLFFAPDGQIVHRGIGAKRADDFLQLAHDAADPNKQYYALLRDYRLGERNYQALPQLARTAKEIKSVAFADTVASDYIQNYLDELTENELLKKENLVFVGLFAIVLTSKDPVFNYFRSRPAKIDSLVNDPGYAKAVVEYTITKEEIDSKLWVHNEPRDVRPNWSAIGRHIKKKYGPNLAKSTILNAKLKWYNYFKDWRQVVKYNIRKIDEYGVDTTTLGKVLLDNMIWDIIFKHSDEKYALNRGIKWMKLLIAANPNDGVNIDTYANLLYKVGKTPEAIYWEEKAVRLDPKNNQIQEAFSKMKRGEPTW